jgi:uncharacterized damage-inducible protein DinB
MDTLQQLKDELQQEYNTTQQFLKNYPDDKNEYKPHDKSYTLQELANHIVNVFGWPGGIMQTAELDIAPKDGERPAYAASGNDLSAALQRNFEMSLAALKNSTEADLSNNWELKAGGKSLMKWDKYGAIRHSLNQITHHRAQLGVNYRLLGLDVPPSYGPTADHSSGGY